MYLATRTADKIRPHVKRSPDLALVCFDDDRRSLTRGDRNFVQIRRTPHGSIVHLNQLERVLINGDPEHAVRPGVDQPESCSLADGHVDLGQGRGCTRQRVVLDVRVGAICAALPGQRAGRHRTLQY
jgi:hypothetical protein